MKLTILLATLSLAGAALQAAPILQLDPVNGAVTGAPGATVGWGFTITGDSTDWVSFTTSFLLGETNMFGVYTDFVGAQGGPVNAALAPGAQWTQSFDPVNMLGIGSYTIDPATQIGVQNTAQVLLSYDLFSADPNTCGSCYVSSGQLTQNISITTVTPEPGSIWLGLAGAAMLLLRTRYRNGINPKV